MADLCRETVCMSKGREKRLPSRLNVIFIVFLHGSMSTVLLNCLFLIFKHCCFSVSTVLVLYQLSALITPFLECPISFITSYDHLLLVNGHNYRKMLWNLANLASVVPVVPLRGQLKSDIGKVLDRNDARVADVGLPSKGLVKGLAVLLLAARSASYFKYAVECHMQPQAA